MQQSNFGIIQTTWSDGTLMQRLLLISVNLIDGGVCTFFHQPQPSSIAARSSNWQPAMFVVAITSSAG
jgi:hypothetical protein